MEMTVRVPATSANIGPGFDCLGLALDIWATVHVRTVDHSPRPENPIARHVHQGINATYDGVGQPPLLAIDWDRAIPLARGLGGSASLRAAGLLAGNLLLEGRHDIERLLELGTKLE